MAYFKSTDGHYGNWDFNVKRVNLQTALTAAREGGCLLVDATGRGKPLPDSFQKTVPIWCCVLNRAVERLRAGGALRGTGAAGTVAAEAGAARVGPRGGEGAGTGEGPREPELAWEDIPRWPETMALDLAGALGAWRGQVPEGAPAWDAALHLPPWITGNEANSIEARIEGWVDALMASGTDLSELAGALARPLRPLWVTPDTRILTNAVPRPSDLPFTPVLLLNASHSSSRPHRRAAGGGGAAAFQYLPGAGDDEEAWARGLTPEMMWEHAGRLLDAGPAGIEGVIRELVARGHRSGRPAHEAGGGGGGGGGRAAAVELHRLPPKAVLEAGRGASLEPDRAASGLWRLGASGVLVGRADCLGDPAAVFSDADAVVNLSPRQPAGPACARCGDGPGPGPGPLRCCCRPEASCAGPAPADVARLRDRGALGGPGGAPGERAAGWPCSRGAECPACERRSLWLPVQHPKADRSGLARVLPAALEFASHHLARGRRVALACESGIDAAVSVAAALLVACYPAPPEGWFPVLAGAGAGSPPPPREFAAAWGPGEHWSLVRQASAQGGGVTRDVVGRAVAAVCAAVPPARPSKASLKEVLRLFSPQRRPGPGGEGD